MTALTPLLLLLIALQIIDAATTLYGLRSDGAHESNPLMRSLFDRFGDAPVLLITKLAMILAFVIYSDAPHIQALLIAANVLYAGIIVNNFRVLYKLRTR